MAIATDNSNSYYTGPITVKNGSITGWPNVLTEANGLEVNITNVTFSGNGYVIIGGSMMLNVKSSRFVNNT